MNESSTHKWLNFFAKPWHFIGLILFYILHEWLLNFDLVAFFSLVIIVLILLTLSILFYLLFKKLTKNTGKAALLTTLVEFLLLYFGMLQDSISNHQSIAILGEIHILLPLAILIYVGLYFFIKTRKTISERLHQYFNTALVFFVVFELLAFFVGFDKARLQDIAPNDFSFSVHGCDTCKKPPLFLVVMDEYTGADGQINYFGISTQEFNEALTRRGFNVIPHSRSNYMYTVFSMASCLNMQYLNELGEHKAENTFSYQRSLRSIRKSAFVQYLLTQGYTVNNYSSFDLPSKAAKYHNSFLPRDWVLLLNETLYYRLMMVFPHFLAKKLHSPAMLNWLNNRALKDNEDLLESAIPQNISDTSRQFYYIHLMMPHAPYALDEHGSLNKFVDSETRSAAKDSAYLHYLLYTNSKVLPFMDKILQATQGKGIIILMSDHGFRDMYQSKKYEQLTYANFLGVYFPDKNYKDWSDSTSPVNELRIVLNHQFHEQIPLLRDSMVH